MSYLLAYLIRMTYDQCRMSSGWLTMLSYVIRIRSLIWWLSHPDDLTGVGISSGWLTVNSLCHPDDIPFHLMSSGWLNWAWYLIRMSYGSVIMSSGWDTLPVLSHPDEISNFDFPHHAVALQRFRRYGQNAVIPAMLFFLHGLSTNQWFHITFC